MSSEAFEIRPLLAFDPPALAGLIAGGYTSAEKYAVEAHESDSGAEIRLRRVRLAQPYRKTFAVLPEDLQRYAEILKEGFSLGAWAGAGWVAAAIAGAQRWNGALWVWEFHVAPAWQGRGVGRALMEALARRAAAAGLRALVCETQTTNLPAIRFYRALGFSLQGIDLSYYTNRDYPDGEMALFLKRPLEEVPPAP